MAVRATKRKRRRYSAVRLERQPAVELAEYLTVRWGRIVESLATEIAYQEQHGPKFSSFYQVCTTAVWFLGRASFFVTEEDRPENPDKAQAADKVEMYLRSLAALCVRWWAHHEASRSQGR